MPVFVIHAVHDTITPRQRTDMVPTSSTPSLNLPLPSSVTRVVILCALPREAALIREHLEDRHDDERYAVSYSTGFFAGKAVTVGVAGMGTVAAAAAAQFLITQFQPDVFFFSGIAGGLNALLDVGDIVVGKELKYLETNTAIIAECDPFLEVFPSHPALVELAQNALRDLGYAEVPANSEIYSVAPAEREEYLASQKARVAQQVAAAGSHTLPDSQAARIWEEENSTYRGHHFTTGVINTSDEFNTDPAVLEASREREHGDCEEMEGVAAAHVAHRCRIPFLALRSLSNQCGEAYDELGSAEDRMSATARDVAAVALRVVETLD
ncbi:MAG: 5'-methylthioadenosine/S-adenosylhomocysteine nucleosidase [Aeriscardovia aeriphila]|nr:5'-methylthioadenosine/S-adenosylhomocysteine nucleosidase [Aeriscardovia aeriphila]